MNHSRNPTDSAAPSSAALSGPSSNELALQQRESQNQLQGTLLPAGKQDDVRMFRAKDWENHREEITALYENNTLDNVMKSMQARYGLVATPKQYKDRIRKWGQNKNIQSNEMEAMIRKQKEREQEENKQSAFRVRGQEVNAEKIKRYLRDHPRSSNTDEDGDVNMDLNSAETPGGISVYTPADTGPLTPDAIPDTIFNSNPAAKPQASILPPTYSDNSPPQSNAPPKLPPRVQKPTESPIAPPPPPAAMQSFGQGAPQSYAFQYSNCTGRRKALLIGVNYFGQRGQLRGCINDVKNMSAFLHENYGYQRDDMVILTDDQQNPMSQPTKQNVLRGMHWLVKDARPNDSLFFHFSGHGGQTKDLDGDEDDGYDEVIYPVDFRQEGHIVDDEMHRIMVQPLEPGVRLTAIFDSCHSATTLDLPYIYSTQGILKEPNLAKEAGQGLLGVISSYSKGNLGGVANNVMGFFKKAQTGDDAYNKTVATKTSPADIVMWSGSKDDQTSADAAIAAQATGAMSWAFITALKKNPDQSYVQLLNNIRDNLATKYTQKPQLSCSHPLNTNLLFVM